MSTTKLAVLPSLSITFNYVYRFINFNLTKNTTMFHRFLALFDEKWQKVTS